MKNILLAILTAVLFISMPFVLIYLNRVYNLSMGDALVICAPFTIFKGGLAWITVYLINQELKNK